MQSPEATPLLETRGVTVRFGGHVAVSDVSIAVGRGAVTGLIGPNGAGKTTLFNTVTGLQKPTAGQVLIDGVDVTKKAPYKRAHLGLARPLHPLGLVGGGWGGGQQRGGGGHPPPG
ncbi:ATP-binding cassette domain-containing protein, partial [Rhodococcus sp. NPDC058514]|uniref:ATP-binding cassette domain-containing protein n=1 Tax=Rhodococcus sp. NPDC058514 TaxID=3346532 RepID=UPI0036664975